MEVAHRIGSNDVICVAIDEEALRKARKWGLRTIKHDLNIFPYSFTNGEFNVVVLNQVIEHLLYPIRFLKEVYRILEPGGYAVISTENLVSWDNILVLILEYNPSRSNSMKVLRS